VNFWDSSALVPLLLDEAASQTRLAQLAAGGRMVVWWAASVECASAVHRLFRLEKINVPAREAALGRLQNLASTWTEIEPSAEVRLQAERLLRTHPLRAADALQLAAAVISSEYEPDGTNFFTGDLRLAEAAAKEGFKTG